MRSTTLFLAGALTTIIAIPAGAQNRRDRDRNPNEQVQQNAFEWSGELARGNRIVLKNLNGSVTVEPARGRTLEITATKKWRKGDPAQVTIDASRINGGRDILVCAKWSNNTQCDENTYEVRGRWNNDNDTQVDFTIRLPAGADASLNTTNGSIEVGGASGSIEALTTNGDISTATTDGTVSASTTNGNIEVALTKLPASGLTYGTTNGSITLTLPDGLDARITAGTTNGRISSDFPITMSGGSISTRSLRGTIGRGGPLIQLMTTNGNIRIERR